MYLLSVYECTVVVVPTPGTVPGTRYNSTVVYQKINFQCVYQYQFPLPLPKHSNMNNVNHLSIKIPPIHEPSLFHVHHQYTGVTTTDDRSESVVATPSLKSMVPTTSSLPSQHQHQHQQQPAVTTPIDTTLQLGLSARLSRLQELIDNCNVLVEERQEKTNQTIDKSNERSDKSNEPSVAPVSEVAVLEAYLQENEALKKALCNTHDENQILKSAMCALRDCLFIEIDKRTQVESDNRRLAARLAAATARKAYHTKRLHRFAQPSRNVQRRLTLEKTMHYELPVSCVRQSGLGESRPCSFKFHG